MNYRYEVVQVQKTYRQDQADNCDPQRVVFEYNEDGTANMEWEDGPAGSEDGSMVHQWHHEGTPPHSEGDPMVYCCEDDEHRCWYGTECRTGVIDECTGASINLCGKKVLQLSDVYTKAAYVSDSGDLCHQFRGGHNWALYGNHCSPKGYGYPQGGQGLSKAKGNSEVRSWMFGTWQDNCDGLPAFYFCNATPTTDDNGEYIEGIQVEMSTVPKCLKQKYKTVTDYDWQGNDIGTSHRNAHGTRPDWQTDNSADWDNADCNNTYADVCALWEKKKREFRTEVVDYAHDRSAMEREQVWIGPIPEYHVNNIVLCDSSENRPDKTYSSHSIMLNKWGMNCGASGPNWDKEIYTNWRCGRVMGQAYGKCIPLSLDFLTYKCGYCYDAPFGSFNVLTDGRGQEGMFGGHRQYDFSHPGRLAGCSKVKLNISCKKMDNLTNKFDVYGELLVGYPTTGLFPTGQPYHHNNKNLNYTVKTTRYKLWSKRYEYDSRPYNIGNYNLTPLLGVTLYGYDAGQEGIDNYGASAITDMVPHTLLEIASTSYDYFKKRSESPLEWKQLHLRYGDPVIDSKQLFDGTLRTESQKTRAMIVCGANGTESHECYAGWTYVPSTVGVDEASCGGIIDSHCNCIPSQSYGPAQVFFRKYKLWNKLFITEPRARAIYALPEYDCEKQYQKGDIIEYDACEWVAQTQTFNPTGTWVGDPEYRGIGRYDCTQRYTEGDKVRYESGNLTYIWEAKETTADPATECPACPEICAYDCDLTYASGDKAIFSGNGSQVQYVWEANQPVETGNCIEYPEWSCSGIYSRGQKVTVCRNGVGEIIDCAEGAHSGYWIACTGDNDTYSGDGSCCTAKTEACNDYPIFQCTGEYAAWDIVISGGGCEYYTTPTALGPYSEYNCSGVEYVSGDIVTYNGDLYERNDVTGEPPCFKNAEILPWHGCGPTGADGAHNAGVGSYNAYPIGSIVSIDGTECDQCGIGGHLSDCWTAVIVDDRPTGIVDEDFLTFPDFDCTATYEESNTVRHTGSDGIMTGWRAKETVTPNADCLPNFNCRVDYEVGDVVKHTGSDGIMTGWICRIDTSSNPFKQGYTQYGKIDDYGVSKVFGYNPLDGTADNWCYDKFDGCKRGAEKYVAGDQVQHTGADGILTFWTAPGDIVPDVNDLPAYDPDYSWNAEFGTCGQENTRSAVWEDGVMISPYEVIPARTYNRWNNDIVKHTGIDGSMSGWTPKVNVTVRACSSDKVLTCEDSAKVYTEGYSTYTLQVTCEFDIDSWEPAYQADWQGNLIVPHNPLFVGDVDDLPEYDPNLSMVDGECLATTIYNRNNISDYDNMGYPIYNDVIKHTGIDGTMSGWVPKGKIMAGADAGCCTEEQCKGNLSSYASPGRDCEFNPDSWDTVTDFCIPFQPDDWTRGDPDDACCPFVGATDIDETLGTYYSPAVKNSNYAIKWQRFQEGGYSPDKFCCTLDESQWEGTGTPLTQQACRQFADQIEDNYGPGVGVTVYWERCDSLNCCEFDPVEWNFSGNCFSSWLPTGVCCAFDETIWTETGLCCEFNYDKWNKQERAYCCPFVTGQWNQQDQVSECNEGCCEFDVPEYNCHGEYMIGDYIRHTGADGEMSYWTASTKISAAECYDTDFCCPFDESQWSRGDSRSPYWDNGTLGCVDDTMAIDEHWYNAYYHRDANTSDSSAPKYNSGNYYKKGDRVVWPTGRTFFGEEHVYTNISNSNPSAADGHAGAGDDHAYGAEGLEQKYDDAGNKVRLAIMDGEGFNKSRWLIGSELTNSSKAKAFEWLDYPNNYPYAKYTRRVLAHSPGSLREAYPFSEGCNCSNAVVGGYECFNPHTDYGIKYDGGRDDCGGPLKHSPIVIADSEGFNQNNLNPDGGFGHLRMWILAMSPGVNWDADHKRASNASTIVCGKEFKNYTVKGWWVCDPSKQGTWYSHGSAGTAYNGSDTSEHGSRDFPDKWRAVGTTEDTLRCPRDNMLYFGSLTSVIQPGASWRPGRYGQPAAGQSCRADGGKPMKKVPNFSQGRDINCELETEDNQPVMSEPCWIPAGNSFGYTFKGAPGGPPGQECQYRCSPDWNPNYGYCLLRFADGLGNDQYNFDGFNSRSTYNWCDWRQVIQPEYFDGNDKMEFSGINSGENILRETIKAGSPPNGYEGSLYRSDTSTTALDAFPHDRRHFGETVGQESVQQKSLDLTTLCPAVHVLKRSTNGQGLQAAIWWDSYSVWGDAERKQKGQRESYTYREYIYGSDETCGCTQSPDAVCPCYLPKDHLINGPVDLISWKLRWFDGKNEITSAVSPPSFPILNDALNNRCDPEESFEDGDGCITVNGSRFSPCWENVTPTTYIKNGMNTQQHSWMPWMEWSSDTWLYLYNFPLSTKDFEKYDIDLSIYSDLSSIVGDRKLPWSYGDAPYLGMELAHPSYIPPATETYSDSKEGGYPHIIVSSLLHPTVLLYDEYGNPIMEWEDGPAGSEDGEMVHQTEGPECIPPYWVMGGKWADNNSVLPPPMRVEHSPNHIDNPYKNSTNAALIKATTKEYTAIAPSTGYPPTWDSTHSDTAGDSCPYLVGSIVEVGGDPAKTYQAIRIDPDGGTGGETPDTAVGTGPGGKSLFWTRLSDYNASNRCVVAGPWNPAKWFEQEGDGYIWKDWMVSHSAGHGNCGKLWIPIGCRALDAYTGKEHMRATTYLAGNNKGGVQDGMSHGNRRYDVLGRTVGVPLVPPGKDHSQTDDV
tara:strand:- start:1066 stop:9207 length:8142 start_codon:yes stop_codon:yes gene_type:complete